MTRILPILWLMFKVWLLIDVHRKRMPQYWFFIIFFVPFGDVVYFILYKVKDFKKGKWLDSPPTLAEVEHRYRTTPSVNNRLLYAKALFDAERRTDALWHFDGILEGDNENQDALYGKATCMIEAGDFEGGVPILQQLVDRWPSYRDFQVWTDLANAQWQNGRRDDCLETLRQLVRARSRVDHQLALAQCLIEMGHHDEAQRLIATALSEYDQSPPHTRRLYRKSAKTLRGLKR